MGINRKSEIQMLTLSIITINYNNAEGLRKTLASVAAQTYPNIEHIIVDGNSTDGSVDVIREYESTLASSLSPFASRLKWLSEPDKGIYNAMNKGIEIALGKRVVNDDHTSTPNAQTPKRPNDYIQILNSGDYLAAPDVIMNMANHLNQSAETVGILYGNMIKEYPNGKRVHSNGSVDMNTMDSFLYFYRGTLNPDGTLIHSSLFEKYGFFNENLRICSDWEWFVNAIALGEEIPVHVNIDSIVFDMMGVSESGGKNRDIITNERRAYLESILPKSVLYDYDTYWFPVTQYQRLKKYHLWGFVHLIERITFKIEKCYNKLIHR